MFTADAMHTQFAGKQEGDISSVFASLSGVKAPPLPERFRELKLSLVAGREEKIIASWNRLLATLKTENEDVANRGTSIIPSVRFENLDEELAASRDEIRKRGVVVIRGVIPEDEARAYKTDVEEYVRKNPHTKGWLVS
jgi:intein/homing endonuclease